MLGCAAGENNHAVALRLDCHDTTVGKWRRRLLKQRIAGLYDELRPGKQRTIDDEHVAMLIRRPLEKKPKSGSTHWSVRSAAAESGISTVARDDVRIKILGRTADVLIIDGRKIAVAPIEEQIGHALEIGGVCMFSGLAPDGSEVIVIALEVAELPAQSRLDEIARQFPMFDAVRWEAVPSFPRTTTGMIKVKRGALRTTLFAHSPPPVVLA